MLIEKGVPRTDARGVGRNPKQPGKYPWADMEVGDSFRAEVKPDVLRAAASKAARRHGLKFVVRLDGDGSRAWRIA